MNLSEIENFEKQVEDLELSLAMQTHFNKELDIAICAARMKGVSDDEIQRLTNSLELCETEVRETQKTIAKCRTKLSIARLEATKKLQIEERSWFDKVKSFFSSHP